MCNIGNRCWIFQECNILIIASLVGCLELVKYFMNNDKNIKYKLSFDKSCSLVYVTQRRNPSAIKYVSDNDGNINATTAQSESYLNAPCIFNEKGGGFIMHQLDPNTQLMH